jgi:hypothetical protein
LTEPWTMVVAAANYRATEFPPLLDLLQGLVTPSAGKTVGGVSAPSERNVLDVKALDLLMSVEDVVGAWLFEWNTPLSKGQDGLVVRVRVFAKLLEVRWQSGGVTETQYTHLTATLIRWAGQIWDLVEPPLQVPLRDATCPECRRAKWVNENDEITDALVVSYRDGGDVQAACRWNSCTFLATGDRALLELGYHVGATVDEDTLRDMGVIG